MYAALVRIQAMQHGKQCPFAGADMVDAGIGQTAGISDGTTLWFLNDASNTAIAYDAATASVRTNATLCCPIATATAPLPAQGTGTDGELCLSSTCKVALNIARCGVQVAGNACPGRSALVPRGWRNLCRGCMDAYLEWGPKGA